MKEKKNDTEVSNGGPSATNSSLWGRTRTFPLYCLIPKVYLIPSEADLLPLWRPVSTHYINTQGKKSTLQMNGGQKPELGVKTAGWGEECDLSIKSQSPNTLAQGLFNQLTFWISCERRAAPTKDVLKPKHSDVWLKWTAVGDDLDLKKQIECLN